MKVALTAEGTYPHQFGGVSVWCDQLIRGLPQHDFTVIPLVATGNEAMRWQLPANVRSVVTIPLWGRPPSVPLRARLSRGRNESMLAELIDVLLGPPSQAQDRFTDVMYEMFSYAQSHDLRATLASETAVRLLSDLWRQRWPEILPEATTAGPDDAAPVTPTLGDAVTAMQLLEHALRPFSHRPVRADVVHAVTNGFGALPAVAAKWRYGLPMIVTEHGVYMREQYMHLRRPQFGWPVKDLYLRFLRRLCTLGYQQADVITPGNIYNQRWETELGADIARVRTVYNGVDPAVFPVLSEEPEVPTISWAGRIDPVKDLETLLRAFSLVVNQIPEARLRIFGSPPAGGEAYLERCRAEAAALGISERATFEGRVPEIRDAYAAGHVVVLCSITEGFPYTLIEAMACGRACVATDVGGVSEAVGDVAGLVVPPRNPAALADACLRLLRDDKLRRTMGAAARDRAVEHFTLDRAISAFDEMYTLLGSPSAKTATAVPATVPAVPLATVPSPESVQQAHETSSRVRRWIELPPEEANTLVEFRPDISRTTRIDHRLRPDQEITQVMPVPGGDSRTPDAERTTMLPVLNPVRPGEPDQDRTTIMPRLVRNVAAPSDLEQTRPMSRLNGEAAADAGQTERRDAVGEESTEAMR
jgi:glycosyltransferase involved in cell wall biosynthesis